MKYYFFSDLHIQNNKDPIYYLLLNILNNLPKEGDQVVFCGDVFDVFVGNKSVFRVQYNEFFNALKKLNKSNLKVYFIEGNHDFLMKKCFMDEGIDIEYSSEKIILTGSNQEKIYCAHGDLINKEDKGYLFLRRVYRSVFFRTLLFLIPGKIIELVGQFLSQYSRGEKPLLPSDLDSSSLLRLRNIYYEFCESLAQTGISHIVLGHCHDLDEKKINLKNHQTHYMNMGYPKVHRTYIVFDCEKSVLSRENFDSA